MIRTHKNRFALWIAAAFSVAFTFTATSCHDNIYSLIMQEVPRQTGLTGDIYNVVPFKGNLYASNSKLYKKELKSSDETSAYNYQWKEVSAMCGEKALEHILTLAADDTNLYCYTVAFKQDVDKSINIAYYKSLYTSTDGENWTQIDISSITGNSDDTHGSYSISPVSLYDNQVGNGVIGSSTSGRKAFVTLDSTQQDSSMKWKVFNLSAGALGSVVKDENTQYLKVANLNGNDIFLLNQAATSNDKFVYYSVGSTLYYTVDGTNIASVDTKAGTIYSLAATKNFLLLGTSAGIYRLALDANGVPSESLTDFDNNAQTLLTSRINSLYVLDSSKNEGETDEYASMIISGYLSSSSDSFDETGLYAFYPGRGNWNRDGN